MTDWLVEILSYDMSNPMQFNSGLFWVLFAIFIPIFGILRRQRTAMMLYVVAFSLFFYYKSSGLFFSLLAVRAIIDYYSAKWIAGSIHKNIRMPLLIFSLLSSIGTLAYFKYANFFILNINKVFAADFQLMDLIIPVGISFYTFQSISYMIDVYRGKTDSAGSLLEYAFYLSFFPSLVAGPIVRAEDFFPQIRMNRKITDHIVFSGFWLVMVGLVKKVIVADLLAQYNDAVFAMPSAFNGIECTMALLGYSVQIYCDFSGYSDMAIGLACIMGFNLGENFRSPYKATNLSEFWHRWHISLSSWLRDYIYIPLGGNRGSRIRTYINTMLTMLIGGLWHGAGWRFVLWGGMHGVGLVVHKLTATAFPCLSTSRIFRFISWTLTFSFVSLLWILFRSENLNDALIFIGQICHTFNAAEIIPFIKARWLWATLLMLSLVGIFAPDTLFKNLKNVYLASNWPVKLFLFIMLVVAILQFMGTTLAPFIYFQF